MSNPTGPEYDVIVVGAGLAGLVAASELIEAGKRVIILDQEPEASLGGQAWWSFGGLFLVDSPEQRRLGVHDPPSSPVRTGSPAPASTARRICGRAVGRGIPRLRRRREARLAA